MAKHTLIFVHGMGDTHPIKGFEALWKGVQAAYDGQSGRSDGDFARRYEACFVDWHEVTDEAKRKVFRDAFPWMEPQEEFPGALLHPIEFARTFFTFFLGDVVAYVDESPNNIRTTFWDKAKAGLAGGGPFSIVAHSLGSVIAFDFLYHLFAEDTLFDPVQAPAATVAELKQRFRGLYTLGSPVGLFMLRKGDLWRRPPPPNAGVPPFSNVVNPIPQGCLWHNYWDRQDIVAYPLELLFATNPANAGKPLHDAEVNTGIEPIFAHIRYWYSTAVAEGIAKSLR